MQISIDGMFAKNLQFVFRKTCAIRFLCHRLSKKLNFIKIWQVKVGQNKNLVCYRQKQSFRQCAWGLRQLVLKPGFRPKGRICKKSQKISTASDQCKKNYRGGGSNWPPSPAGIGLMGLYWPKHHTHMQPLLIKSRWLRRLYSRMEPFLQLNKIIRVRLFFRLTI